MKSHLKIVRLTDRSPEWMKFRLDYIGASEVAAVLRQSEWKFIGRVFDEKTGRVEQWSESNKNSHWGIQKEDLVAKNWQYVDEENEPDAYIKNMIDDNLQRKCKNINGYIINPKYPWLTTNLDRMINKDQFRLDDMNKLLTMECPLEIKTTKSYILKRFDAGLPNDHIIQVTQQMIITETDYAEMAILDSENNLHVFPVPYGKDLADAIIEHSKTFWYDLVLPARELVKQQQNASRRQWEELEAQIAQIEPPPDDSKPCEEYLKERYRDGFIKAITGGMPEYNLSKEYAYLKVLEKEIATLLRERRNKLKSFMADHNEIDFEGAGRVDWKNDSRGTRRFAVRLKDYTPDKEFIKEQVSKLEIG